MRYRPTVQTSAPETLSGLPAGQWISYDGTRGRYMGRRNGTVWIAWGRSATHRFAAFAAAYSA